MITPPQILLLILGHQQILVSFTSQIPLLWLVQESPTGLKTRLPYFLAIPVLHSISRHHILLLYRHSYDPLHLNGTIMGVYLPQSEPNDWTSRYTPVTSLIRIFVAQRLDHQRNRHFETDVALPIRQQTLCVELGVTHRTIVLLWPVDLQPASRQCVLCSLPPYL
jgi:hypothetical protein